MNSGDSKHSALERKAKRRPAASSVVAQARAQTAESEPIKPVNFTRVEQRTADDGTSTLLAIFPRSGGGRPLAVNLSFLLEFPGLQSMFSTAFLIWGATLTQHSREEAARNLGRYFFTFLRSEHLTSLRPEEIDDYVLSGFKQFLQAPRAEGKPLHPSTISRTLGGVRTMLGSVVSGPWADVARRVAERVPAGPVGAARKTEPTEVIPLETLLAVMAAAEREVCELAERWNRGRVLLSAGRAKLVSEHLDFTDLPTCLAVLDADWPEVIPDVIRIGVTKPRLVTAIHQIHGARNVAGYFYASSRDLVPCILLMSISTVFNPDTVLSLEWDNIDLDACRAGKPAIKIAGVKGRAQENLTRLLDPVAGVSSELNLLELLDLLKKLTERIRPAANSSYIDRLFLYVPVFGKIAKSFGNDHQLPSCDAVWKRGLANFIRDNNLPRFTLGQLRPTILDMVQSLNGSLEEAQKVGNHRRPATTWTHYTSSGVKKRYRERIGEVLLLRERWLATEGKVDPRRLTQDQDRGAATPGFLCFDPFDSPRPNQKIGRLCTDYGGCPSCPLAGARPRDPACVSLYRALQRAIYASQPQMAAETWLGRWAPVLSDLNSLLACVPAEILEESNSVYIELPKVG